MKPLWNALLFVLATGLCAPLAAAQKKSKFDPRVPEVGRIAPPIGELGWMQLGPDGGSAPTQLMQMRGSVVIVADYGYYCDSCVRVGVPVLNAMRAANEPAELRVLHLTAAVGEDTNESVLAEGNKLGLSGPLAITDVEGEGSAYLDMGRNGNLTFATVIGRHGGVVWKGDPSRKRDEYIQAVSDALHAVPCAPLPAADAFGEALAPALSDYILGDFQKAEATAQALLKKIGNKSGAEADKTKADATALVELIEKTRRPLMDELERSGGIQDAERFAKVVAQVRRAFPKGAENNRVGELEMVVQIQNDQGPNCRKWATWYALEASRPANFPAEKDPAGTKYARELAKYAKQEDVPGLERARQWLDAFAKLGERK
jgi:hypothetical protein